MRVTRGDGVDAACGQLVGELSNTIKGKNLIKHRSKGMLKKKVFKSQIEINQHVYSIEKAKLDLSDAERTIELKNWLNYLKN